MNYLKKKKAYSIYVSAKKSMCYVSSNECRIDRVIDNEPIYLLLGRQNWETT